MYGIVGYIGKQEAYPILIQGLKRLEYRGYDSAGVASVSPEGELEVYKTKGKAVNLEKRANNADHRGRNGDCPYAPGSYLYQDTVSYKGSSHENEIIYRIFTS